MIRPADEVLLGFAHAVRAAGVAVTPDRSRSFLEAVALAGAGDPRGTYAAGRATLCGCPDDLRRFDRVFAAWFGTDGLPRPAAAGATYSPAAGGALEPAGSDPDPLTTGVASETEVLRHRDVAELSAAERQRLAGLFGRLEVHPPTRRAVRRTPSRRGAVDGPRTMRASLRRWGEPAEIRRRRRATAARRVVLLVDVSGSMSGYADALLRLAHRLTAASGRAPVETFALGTRLTHLTRAMRAPDAERALVAAGEAVPDWSGGTRLGETLRAFLDRWGQRGLARGAVVVVFSDGWERGDPALLAQQVERLSRLAHRVVWVNPHRGKEGYEPVQQGVRAVLPHVDHFLAGHSLATFAELTEVLRRA